MDLNSSDETATLQAEAATIGPEGDEPNLRSSYVGRFLVLEEIGRGGMGRVLRAYDPKLEREVALKKLQGRALGVGGAVRLIGEARAMAKLSHPNVVAVFDVESEDDDVVLVMEYVKGATLKDWLAEGPHPWQRIVDRFIEAGQGLAAANAAGLLHRDFKPANVLVDPQGRVKVTDFGLAKSGAWSTDSGGDSQDAVTDPRGLTQTGVVLGTPLYMAPEQHASLELTPAIDQYAFCVALWEALNGARPFPAANAVDKMRGPPAWKNLDVPKAVVDGVVRGLSPRPADRWPDLEALLGVLRQSLAGAAKGRRMLAWGSVTVLGAAAVFGYAWTQARAARCSGALDQLGTAWDTDRRADVRTAFERVNADYGRTAMARADAVLQGWAQGWVAMHTDACEATTIRGEQSAALLDLRMACLRSARDGLAATTEVLAKADAAVVQRLDEILEGLPALDRCADTASLQQDTEAPSAAESAAVAEVRALLSRADAAARAGQYAKAREIITQAQEATRPITYRRLHAEVALGDGSVARRSMRGDDAAAALKQALELGAEARQWDIVRRAATQLLFVVGSQQGLHDKALAYRELALGLANGSPVGRANVLNNLVPIHIEKGELALAETLQREALALHLASGDSTSLGVAAVRDTLAGVLQTRDKLEEAEVERRAALQIRRALLGEDHPEVLTLRSNLAMLWTRQGKFDAARDELTRVLALQEAVLRPGHPSALRTRSSLAVVAQETDDYVRAASEFQRVLTLREESLPAGHPDIVATRNNLAAAQLALGQRAQGEAQLRQALATQIAESRADEPVTLSIKQNLVAVLYDGGNVQEAEALLRELIEDLERIFGADHGATVLARGNLGAVLLTVGRVDEAEVELQRALASTLRVGGPTDPSLAGLHNTIAGVAAMRGDTAAALAEHEQVRELVEASLGADAVALVAYRLDVAEAFVTAGDFAHAQPLAEAAWERTQRGGVTRPITLRAALIVAQARWGLAHGKSEWEHARAPALAALAGLGPPEEALTEAVALRTWLAEHDGTRDKAP